MSSESSSKRESVLFDLTEGERWWRDHYDILKAHCYQLRPRYHPDWKPSWKKLPGIREDGYPTYHPKVIDAIRSKDNAQVAIKKLRKGSRELEIARYLDSGELRKDKRNITVPILDVFSDENSTMEFMVMPLLKQFDYPSFSSVDEVIEFMKQTLQGLSFMHEKGVAHRDCSVLNTMMDASPLYPNGFHAAAPNLDSRGKFLSNPRHRRDVPSVKHYFTDFGISTRFDPSGKDHLVTGNDCQDRQLPEIHQDGPYDPFLADVFILGNLYKHCFVKEYENLEFLAPLAEAMTQKNPSDRPSINVCLDVLDQLIKQQTPRDLRRILIYWDASKSDRITCNFLSRKREATIAIKNLLKRFWWHAMIK